MSKHAVAAGAVAELLDRFTELNRKAQAQTGKCFPIIVIQEAGLDGFWIHRVLQAEGSKVMSSIPPRLPSHAGGGGQRPTRSTATHWCGHCWPISEVSRGCAMVRVPTPEEEDRRRISRERKALTNERVRHVNRIKGLLFSQGVCGYEPLRRDRRKQLDELKTGDDRPLPAHLKAQVDRELDRLELVLEQVKAVEAERDAMLAAAQEVVSPAPAMLLNLKGIGPEFAVIL